MIEPNSVVVRGTPGALSIARNIQPWPLWQEALGYRRKSRSEAGQKWRRDALARDLRKFKPIESQRIPSANKEAELRYVILRGIAALLERREGFIVEDAGGVREDSSRAAPTYAVSSAVYANQLCNKILSLKFANLRSLCKWCLGLMKLFFTMDNRYRNRPFFVTASITPAKKLLDCAARYSLPFTSIIMIHTHSQRTVSNK